MSDTQTTAELLIAFHNELVAGGIKPDLIHGLVMEAAITQMRTGRPFTTKALTPA